MGESLHPSHLQTEVEVWSTFLLYSSAQVKGEDVPLSLSM